MFDQPSETAPEQWTAADLDAFIAALAQPLPKGLSKVELVEYRWALRELIEACDAARERLLEPDAK